MMVARFYVIVPIHSKRQTPEHKHKKVTKDDQLGNGLAKRLDVPPNPIQNLRKPEFVPVHRSNDERVTVRAIHIDVGTIPAQKHIGRRKGDALVAVNEAVFMSQRLHERGGLLFNATVIAGLRTKHRCLNGRFIAHAVSAAEQINQPMLHPVDFRHREKIRHLLGEPLQQFAVARY